MCSCHLIFINSNCYLNNNAYTRLIKVNSYFDCEVLKQSLLFPALVMKNVRYFAGLGALLNDTVLCALQGILQTSPVWEGCVTSEKLDCMVTGDFLLEKIQ